jgi:hypothetical protein
VPMSSGENRAIPGVALAVSLRLPVSHEPRDLQGGTGVSPVPVMVRQDVGRDRALLSTQQGQNARATPANSAPVSNQARTRRSSSVRDTVECSMQPAKLGGTGVSPVLFRCNGHRVFPVTDCRQKVPFRRP